MLKLKPVIPDVSFSINLLDAVYLIWCPKFKSIICFSYLVQFASCDLLLTSAWFPAPHSLPKKLYSYLYAGSKFSEPARVDKVEMPTFSANYFKFFFADS